MRSLADEKSSKFQSRLSEASRLSYFLWFASLVLPCVGRSEWFFGIQCLGIMLFRIVFLVPTAIRTSVLHAEDLFFVLVFLSNLLLLLPVVLNIRTGSRSRLLIYFVAMICSFFSIGITNELLVGFFCWQGSFVLAFATEFTHTLFKDGIPEFSRKFSLQFAFAFTAIIGVLLAVFTPGTNLVTASQFSSVAAAIFSGFVGGALIGLVVKWDDWKLVLGIACFCAFCAGIVSIVRVGHVVIF